ncbi:MAG: ComEC family competence protein [Bacteroidetes bacterium]|nr:ComEC family competence protein [Bacteroidota bacterium]MBT6687755.1 ComEC family competence protein [Bacteroidota bacterium]MBT7143389.1 ComEC family competence protein [Bacteroidota bacterium]MBT7490711.1 ComEC family competence protein [Bacteroidota bacterium]
MQDFLKKIPFLRLVIPFIIGIFVGIEFDLSQNIILILILIFFLCLIFLQFAKKINNQYSHRWIFGGFLFVLFIFFGITSVNIKKSDSPKQTKPDEKLIIGKIIEPLLENKNFYKTKLEIEAIKYDSAWIHKNQKAIIYFKKIDSIIPKFGSKLLISCKLNFISEPKNPHEFNYKKYLEHQQIYFQSFVSENKWQFLEKQAINPILYSSQILKNKILNIYQNHGIIDKEFAVLSAITLGYREKLDAETKQVFSASGAMHILAVSGLHIGIVYFIFSYLLKFLEKFKKGIIIKSCLLIILLAYYAYLTGLSPSVIRATIMFIFIILGKLINRQSNIYNILSISAFFMLLYNPYYILNVGFQLSYVAVAGIVFIQPKLYNLVKIKYWVFQKIYALITVAIAAQIATAPIGLFYFHQFPNYFLITNILAIPLAFLIMYFAISLLAFSFSETIANFLAGILHQIVKYLNNSLNYIETLPFSVTQNISIGISELIIIYILTVFTIAFFLHKKYKYLLISLTSILVLFGINFVSQTNKHNKHFFVYNISGHSAINFIGYNENILFCDSALIHDSKKIDFHIKNNWIKSGLEQNSTLCIPDSQLYNYHDISLQQFIIKNNASFFRFYDKQIFILNDSEILSYTAKEKLELDFVIISKNIKTSISDLLNLFRIKKIIFDSSINKKKLSVWTNECENLNIEYHAVSNDNFFVYKIDE